MTRAYKLPMKIPATARRRLRITASPCHDDALADIIAEARGCLGKDSDCTEALGSGS
jgi:hypothetical protein